VSASRRVRELRALVLASVIGGLAFLGEAFPPLVGRPIPGLFFHASIVMSAILGQLLLTRFSETDVELEKRTKELEQSYAELTEAQNELVRREQLAAVGELSAVIAHEIRNPLAILRNAASGLRRPKLTPEDRTTLLEILNEETDGLTRLVSDLSTYAQPVVTARATVALDELVRDALASTLGPDSKRAVEVEVDVDGDTPAIEGDPVLLGRALANVLDNAVQAMSSGGTLTLRVAKAELAGERAAEVVVTDTGEGMDSSELRKALDPFFTTRARGTGLGLAIVDRVVRAHGGRVTLESAPGEGCTVRIVLPARPAPRLATPDP
jgi:signal transduction histidine kinase